VPALNRPEVMIGMAMDENGNIADEHTLAKIKELLEALVV